MIPEALHHKSVQHADVAPSTYGGAQYGTASYGTDHLIIELQGSAASQLGRAITPLALATKVLDHWQNHALLK